MQDPRNLFAKNYLLNYNKIVKAIKIILFSLILLIAGYTLGNVLPFKGFLGQDSIVGKAKLEVKVLQENNLPIENLEVDVAEQPGPPKEGGAIKTNSEGVAFFEIKPGHYFIFFNANNFPDQFQTPKDIEIDVAEGQTTKKTIILENK